MDKLGIVFSSRVRSALLGVLAVWILLVYGVSAAQVIGAYVAGDGFDVTLHEFLVVDLVVFYPYLLVAAVILRSLAARIALYRKLKRQIVVPEYTPPEVLTPAEAGLLVDNDFTFREIAATLKDLELRGHLRIIEKRGEVQLQLMDCQSLSNIERLFLQTLLEADGTFSSRASGSGRRLLSAGRQLAGSTREQLVRGGQLPESRNLNKLIRGIFAFFAVIAAGIQLILSLAVTDLHEVLAIGYPRHAMHILEPALELTLGIVMALIIAGGFRQQSLADDNGLKNWRYVAGLKMFIEKAYKDRFYRDGKQMATDQDLRLFYPYAIALGIEKGFAEKLRASLLP